MCRKKRNKWNIMKKNLFFIAKRPLSESKIWYMEAIIINKKFGNWWADVIIDNFYECWIKNYILSVMPVGWERIPTKSNQKMLLKSEKGNEKMG